MSTEHESDGEPRLRVVAAISPAASIPEAKSFIDIRAVGHGEIRGTADYLGAQAALSRLMRAKPAKSARVFGSFTVATS